MLPALMMVTLLASGTGQAAMPKDYASAPSYKYAQLSAPACYAELRKRKVAFSRVAKARGVLAPVRIQKGLRGIRFHTLLPPAKRASSVWEVFDCRLVLALHDFSKILKSHNIDDVVIFSAWRPPSKKWKKGKIGKRHPGIVSVQKPNQPGQYSRAQKWQNK